MIKLRSMSIAEKHELWKRLNRGTDGTVFVPILRREDMPKKLVKEYPPDKRPAGKNVMWCCYCADWTIYEHFAYVSSDKCIGCGISTKDYYIRSANHLWKKEG